MHQIYSTTRAHTYTHRFSNEQTSKGDVLLSYLAHRHVVRVKCMRARVAADITGIVHDTPVAPVHLHLVQDSHVAWATPQSFGLQGIGIQPVQ